MFFPWRKSNSSTKSNKLLKPIERHLSVPLADTQSVTHDIKSVERINLQRAIDRWVEAAKFPVEVCGFSSTGYMGDDSLAKHLMTDELIKSPVERAELESGIGETLDCVHRGLYMLHHNNVPVVLGFRPSRFTDPLLVLEVLAPTRESARNTLRDLISAASKDNIYKGRTISVEGSGTWREEFVIRFQQLREANRDDIVLPRELIETVERNILGMLHHGATLRLAGRSLRHGLLFHGPPGTGKSMMVRYLAHACTEHTVILMAGWQQKLVREACQLARILSPSIVVMEDVDLIASEREHNQCPAILHDLMNEMDGLGPRAEVIFLLTTNRPEILEPALSARPGRIDQAIEFPLPDDACRHRLFQVYGRGLNLSALDLNRWVGQTAGVSPAFIEELLRKATLMAAERGAVGPNLPLTDEDVQNALRELVFFGGELTQKLLGYRSSRIGYQAVIDKLGKP